MHQSVATKDNMSIELYLEEDQHTMLKVVADVTDVRIRALL